MLPNVKLEITNYNFSSRIHVGNEVKFQEYKSKLNCPDSCNDSSFDSGIIYNMYYALCENGCCR